MFGYRMDVHTPDEIAAQDPFGGSGTELLHPPGMAPGEACAVIAQLFPGVPSASFPGRSWLDISGMDGDVIHAIWDSAGARKV